MSAEEIIARVAAQLIAIGVEFGRNEYNLVRGVEKAARDLSKKLKDTRLYLDDAEMRTVKEWLAMDDAERRSVEYKSITNNWLKRLEYACYEMDDVLDECDYILLKQEMKQQSNAEVAPKHTVCSFIPSPSSCLCFTKVLNRRHIAKKILHVKAQLVQILGEKDRYGFATSQTTGPSTNQAWRGQSTSNVEVEKVLGRDHDRDILRAKLMPAGGDVGQEESHIQMISIVGSGGLGKTTLAQYIYNDKPVEKHFKLLIWICVSEPFDWMDIVKRIVEKVKKSCPETNDFDTLLNDHLKECIKGKKFLLVLDDMWAVNNTGWESVKICLNFGAIGSKVLVTTRIEEVAIMMGTKENAMHRPTVLSNDDCWSIVRHIALSDKCEEECKILLETGMKIVEKCKGLPLAAKTMGSLLRSKHGLKEWESVLHSEIWKMSAARIDIFPHLLLSYNELSPTLKRCFSYCSIFPKDYEINVKSLIRQWLALGYLGSDGSTSDLEYRGREYLDTLAMHSLFQNFKFDNFKKHVIIQCKMHDIVHDFVQFLRKGRSNVEIVEATCQICNPSSVSHVKEYHSTFLSRKLVPLYICDCLVSLRVLSLAYCDLNSIPNGIEKLIHLRYLDLVGNNSLTMSDLKIVCRLYNLKSLVLSNCQLKEIPWEIENLIRLCHLDLRGNRFFKLPESIYNLHELHTLYIEWSEELCEFLQGAHKFTNLKHLYMEKFWGKLSWLNAANQLSGSFKLTIPRIRGEEGVVEEANGAELFNKMYLEQLQIKFTYDGNHEDKHEEASMAVLNALKPHPNLSFLLIQHCMCSKLPDWITSPLNQLTHISLRFSHILIVLPPLGKLPNLEELHVRYLQKLEIVGRELLGITKDMKNIGSSSSTITGFPKLKILSFDYCARWSKWEDITADEEASPTLSLFPCLKELHISKCESMSVLPHRIIRKASLLETLNVGGSPQLLRNYDKTDNNSNWKFISHIHNLNDNFYWRFTTHARPYKY